MSTFLNFYPKKTQEQTYVIKPKLKLSERIVEKSLQEQSVAEIVTVTIDQPSNIQRNRSRAISCSRYVSRSPSKVD